MANSQNLCDTRRQLFCIVLVAVFQAIAGQIHYSIPEELQKGSFVGDVAKDLGMDLKQLSRLLLKVGNNILPSISKMVICMLRKG